MPDRAIGMKAARRVADLVHQILELEDAKATAAAEASARLKVLRMNLRNASQDIRSGQLGMFANGS